MTTTSYIWDSTQNKLVLKSEYLAPERKGSAAVHGDIESFVSPIDGSVITDRGQLRRHNAEHGVTDSRDYSKDYYDTANKRMEAERLGNTKEAKAERIKLIDNTLRQFGR